MEKEIQVWNKVMSSALAIPGVKIDRQNFLTSELRQFCQPEELPKAVNNPVDVLTKKQIKTVADSCINNHMLKVTTLSFVAGLPGGWGMAAAIPADMAQYFYHTIVLAQKLAYLYGVPDLCDENGNLTETSQDMLTFFVGVMMGVAVAGDAIIKVSKAFAAQVAKKLPQKALTKTVYYPIIKKTAYWLGVKLTRKSFANVLSKSIPLVGGVISGGLTAATFRPAAQRLQKKLEEQMYEIRNFADYDESEVISDSEA